MEPSRVGETHCFVWHRVSDVIDEPAAPAVASVDGPGDFDTFCRAELDWARQLAYVMTADAQAADDIAQEALARVCTRFVTLENPRAYLRVVIVNLGRRQRRRDDRVRPLNEHDDGASNAVSAESVEILALVDRLPSRQRAVLVLRYYEGLSEIEIAAALQCRPGTVKSLASARFDAYERNWIDEPLRRRRPGAPDHDRAPRTGAHPPRAVRLARGHRRSRTRRAAQPLGPARPGRSRGRCSAASVAVVVADRTPSHTAVRVTAPSSSTPRPSASATPADCPAITPVGRIASPDAGLEAVCLPDPAPGFPLRRAPDELAVQDGAQTAIFLVGVTPLRFAPPSRTGRS